MSIGARRALRSAGPLAVAACVVVSVLLLALVGLPAIALARQALHGSDAVAALERPWQALCASIAWAFGAAAAGTALAWPASRVFRRGGAGAGAAAAAWFTLLPLSLPPWLLYASLWMNAGPGTAIGDWSERHDLVSSMRMAILAAALVTWSSAVAFAVLAGTGPRALSADERLLAIDGSGLVARVRAAIARDARSLWVAIFLATAFLLSETTVFDLAQVPTLGFELRTLDALGATPGAVARAAIPAVLLALAAGACIPLAARAVGDDRLRARGPSRPAGGARVPGGLTLLAALPAAAFLAALVRVEASVPRAGDFFVLHGSAFATTFAVALAVAAVIGTLAAGLRVLLSSPHAPGAAPSARAMALVLVAAGLLPATITALSIEAAYNTGLFAFLYDSPAALVLTLAARTAPIAAVVALAFAAREPRTASRLRAADGLRWRAAWRGLRSEITTVALGAGATAFAWSLGELTASGRVVPPGVPWIATDILNAIHYQRPDTVVLATAGLVVAAVPATILLARALRRLQGQALLVAALVPLASILFTGCGKAPADGTPPVVDPSDPDDRVMNALRAASPEVKDALPVSLEVGGAGRGRGQFYGPRVLAVDRRSGDFFAIDKDARVQAFAADGTQRAEWRMPKSDRGKPTGASVAPDGTLVVADTHEHRLVAYSPSGELLWTLGEYGKEPGQFIYPTDIAFLPDGRMLVAEYGGNDRIQAFGADRRVMHQFGRSGVEPGEFLRPQAMAYDAERDELYVVDAGNHRVQVFTSDGELRRTFGKTGLGAGELNYPFGITLLVGGRATDALGQAQGVDGAPDHGAARRTVVVAEHSNHRVQVLDGTTGESLGIAGGIGRERGRLKYPWAIEPAGVASDGSQRFALCDHGNSRIVFFTLPAGR